MTNAGATRSLFYEIKPGDTLEKIVRGPLKGAFPVPTKGTIPFIQKLNPHILNPNVIRAGDLLLIQANSCDSANLQNLGAMKYAADTWRRAPTQTRQYLLQHFDLIDKITDFIEAGENLGNQSSPWLAKIPRFTVKATEGTAFFVQGLYGQLSAHRQETIRLLNRFQIATMGTPVILLDTKVSNFYTLSNKLE